MARSFVFARLKEKVISHNFTRTALASLILMSLTAWADAPNGAPPVSTSPAKPAVAPPAQIDEAAKALLQQIAGTYKNLKSYADTMRSTITDAGHEPVVFSVQTAFQRPDKALVKRTDEHGTAVFAVDGRTLYTSLPQVKDKYLKRIAEPQWPLPQLVDTALSQTGGIGPGLDWWLSGHDLLYETGLPVSFKVGGPSQVDGVSVDSLVIAAHTPLWDKTLTFFTGHSDHLIRRITMKLTGKDFNGKDKTSSGVEEHRNVQMNTRLAPSLLKFVPPVGAKASESLSGP